MPTRCCSSADSTPRPWCSQWPLSARHKWPGALQSGFAPAVQIRIIGSLVVLAFPLVFLGLMVTPPLFPALALIAATYGAANGIMTIVRGLVVPEMLTRDAYGAINGALAVPTIFAKAAAPLGAALLWASSGSYISVLIAMLGGSLLLITASWVSEFLVTHRNKVGMQ
jgi:hypothetical protein